MLLRQVRKLSAGPVTPTSNSGWMGGYSSFSGPRFGTSAGVGMDADQAMRIATAYRCCTLISGNMASAPPIVYQADAKDPRAKVRMPDHPVYRLIHDQPNDWQTSAEWIHYLVMCLCLDGNSYNRIRWDGRGDPAAIEPLAPGRVRRVKTVAGGWQLKYREENGDESTFIPGELLHVHGPSLDGVTGLNPIEYHRETLGVVRAQQDYYSHFLRNDGQAPGYFTMPGSFGTPEKRRQFREDYQKMQTGENRGKMAVLEFGMELKELGMKHTDAQFLELMKFSRSDIALIYGVPGHKAANLERATLNNVEALAIEYVQDTLLTIARFIEQAIQRDVIVEPGVRVEILLDGLMRGDSKARALFYQALVQLGILTRNEARLAENLPPLPGLDEPLMPVNLTTTDQALLINQPQQDPGTPPDEQNAADLQRVTALLADPAPAQSGGAVVPAASPAPVYGRAVAVIRANAERCLVREVGRLQALAKRTANDAAAFGAGLPALYAEHAEFLAKSLAMPPARAQDYCTRQAETLAANGLSAAERWGADHIQHLVELTLEP